MKIKISRAPSPAVAAESTTAAPYTTTTSDSIQPNVQNDTSTMPEPRQEATKTVKSHQARNELRVKTNRARSRLLLLIACLSYIVIVFTTLSIGLQNISAYLKPRLGNAHIELRAQGNLMYREQMLYTQLDKVLATQLTRGGFMETYEDCLARGLQEANQQYFGLGFQYPEIREQTIDWTVQNCGRLLYAVQLLQPTPQQTVLNHWARTTYRARRVVEKTFNLVTSALGRWFEQIGSQPLTATGLVARLRKQIGTESLTHDRKPRAPRTPRTRMPFGFDLNCEGSSPCRLTYPKIAGVPADKVSISTEDIVKTVRKVEELSSFFVKLDAFQNVMALLALLFVPLEVLCLIAYSVAGIYVLQLTPAPAANHQKNISAVRPSARRFTNEEHYAAGSIAVQLLTMIAHMGTEQVPNPSGKVAMITGIAMTMLGFTMLINLFVPIEQLENVFQMWEWIEELYLIITSRDAKNCEHLMPVPAEATDTDNTDVATEKDIAKRLDVEEAISGNPTSPASFPAETPRILRQPVSPVTTLQEDIRSELIAMREERKNNVYVESDSESDIDGEGFVDLAGGITPATTEVDDWSVVDA